KSPWPGRTFRTARNLGDLSSGTERSAERTCEPGLGNWLHDGPNGSHGAPTPGCCAGPAVRHLYPCAVLRDAMRVLRLQHLHARRAGRREPIRLAGGSARRARPCSVAAGLTTSIKSSSRPAAGRHRVRRWRDALAAGWRRSCDGARCAPRTFHAGRGRRGDDRGEPESTSPRFFERLRAAGFTRVSLGMQSLAPHVLAVLDRVHSPGRALDAAREARGAGFDHVNLDLIYGTPGESDDDLRRSVDAAIDAGVDHVSGYALVVEDGTALARRVRRGEIAAPDNDVLAQRYELLDARLSAAGFDWYEVSNWSRTGGECRHNIGYWNGGEWWGAGPGAHGYVGAT